MHRLILGYLAVSAAVLGVWATAAPASFSGDFGWSRPWVAVDGPFNEHLAYHAAHLAPLGAADAASHVALATQLVLPLLLLAMSMRRSAVET